MLESYAHRHTSQKIPYYYRRPVVFSVHRLEEVVELSLRSARAQLANDIKKSTAHEACSSSRCIHNVVSRSYIGNAGRALIKRLRREENLAGLAIESMTIIQDAIKGLFPNKHCTKA